MTGLQYNNDYKAALRRYTERLNDKIKDELKKENPDLTRINQLKQAKYITPLFEGGTNIFERFRNPW